MERREFVATSVIGSVGLLAGALPGNASPQPRTETRTMSDAPVAATRKILIAGGNFNTTYIRYMATLTGKKRPRLLYLPTATADSATAAVDWFKACAPLDVEPHVQNAFIESLTQTQGWDEVLL
jgi:hypothetical protein